MSERTPGPWRHGPYMHDKKYRVVYFSTKRGEPYGTSPLEPADARLIAAAPDLLEACKAFVALFRDSDMRPEDDCRELYETMSAAIAKAAPANPAP